MNELFAPPESGLLISYLRVSLEDENTGESESISNQRDLIVCYLKQHPEFTAYKVMEVVDDGHSGTNFDRPGIKRVLELVRQRKVAAILVKDLSRFGRNYKEVGSYLEQVFPFLGVRFISVNDGYDSNEYIGSTGGLDIACKALVHDLYSRDISRKVKSSRYARLRRGDYFCSVAPYGYVKSSEDKHRLVIDPPAAKVVRRIFDMTLAGFCTTEIARTLNLEDVPSPLIYMRQKYPGKKIAALEDGFWNNFVVLSILYEERYTGKAISGMRPNLRVGSKQRRKTKREDWIIVPDCFEAIVSENEFQEARRCIDHLEKRKMTAPPHLFYKKQQHHGPILLLQYQEIPRFSQLHGRQTDGAGPDRRGPACDPAAGQDRCGYGPADSAGKEKSRYTCIHTGTADQSVRKADQSIKSVPNRAV